MATAKRNVNLNSHNKALIHVIFQLDITTSLGLLKYLHKINIGYKNKC
jgi:hypothetical protein